MTSPQPASTPNADGGRRPSSTRAALLFGLPLGLGTLMVIHSGFFRGTLAERYLSHPVEWAEIVLFCCALAALAAKFGRAWFEARAARAVVLPPWDGRPVPAGDAADLLAELQRQPRRRRGTWMVRRVHAVLDFLRSRNAAAGLDDHLRTLADNDSLAVDASYSLIRFICWAIPILGFLGTVLGITDAVAGVTPEVLEQSLNQVTDGLALAFDTTALALALTMVLMFLSFLTERAEAGVLEAVDAYVDRELAHRFERAAGEGIGHVETVRQDIQALLRATEQLVQRQAEVWARTFEEMQGRWEKAEQRREERLAAALEGALERTLQAHARQLAALEGQAVGRGAGLLEQLAAVAQTVRDTGREQCQALVQVSDAITAQADVLGRLQDGERQLVQLQDLLTQNLAAVANVGTFEQAVHSLSAAVHLLSAAAVQTPAGRLPARRAAGNPDDTGKAA